MRERALRESIIIPDLDDILKTRRPIYEKIADVVINIQNENLTEITLKLFEKL